MKTYLTLALIILFQANTFGQKNDSISRFSIQAQFKGSRLDSIRLSLTQGNKEALLKLAPYFDSTKRMTEFLGYHILQTPEREIAERLLDENSLFLKGEISISDTTSATELLSFLRLNFDKIIFDNNANAFLITRLTDRDAKYEVRDLSEGRKNELKAKKDELLNSDWVKQNSLDILIQNENPLILYKIASEFYKGRNRFDNYQNNAERYVELLELLTGTEIGVDNENGKINFHIDKDYYSGSRLNLLIYFAKNYHFYKWDNTLNRFYNNRVKVESLNIENIYFQLLNSKTDSVAINAFVKLTTCDPEKTKIIADEYEKADIEKNYALPTFPYRFLKQMTVFTSYCKTNKIDFSGSKKLHKDIELLKKDLPFKERHKLEDKLIKSMTFNDVTAFEYWCLIYEKNSYLTYSAGRILDMYYSNNWNRIVNSKKLFDAYLKKAKLFEQLGIIGVCNNYLTKFFNSNAEVIRKLKNNNSSDQDIQLQSIKALKFASQAKKETEPIKKTNDGNYNSEVKDFKNEFSNVISAETDSDKRDDKISELFSKINYGQIGLAMSLIENYKFKYKWRKYTFLERDFGFFIGDFEDPKFRNSFLNYYSNHTEKDLYMHYLLLAGIDYMNTDHKMNYDKIYELLKYDEATAFVGGGGGTTRQNEVYSLIKLLELEFNTTLGFPSKLCNSNNVYGCDSYDRKNAWMSYIKEKGLLKSLHNTPQSFNFQ